MTTMMKMEAGIPRRPLNPGEVRERVEEMLAQWVDTHQGHDSGSDAAQEIISDLGEEVESRLAELLEAAKS